MSIHTVKSITPVQIPGAGWGVRQLNKDGGVYWVGAHGPYTLAQAQTAARNLERHIARGGDSYAVPFIPSESS